MKNKLIIGALGITLAHGHQVEAVILEGTALIATGVIIYKCTCGKKYRGRGVRHEYTETKVKGPWDVTLGKKETHKTTITYNENETFYHGDGTITTQEK